MIDIDELEEVLSGICLNCEICGCEECKEKIK